MPWLHPHQQEAIKRIVELDGCAGLFLDVGGGKTRVALAYAKWKLCRRVLIVLPGYVTGVWQDELQKIFWDAPVLDLTDMNATKARATALKEFGDGIVFVSYEGYWRVPLRNEILKWKPDACIMDEIQRIRGRTSRQSKFAGVLGLRVPIRLGLSATPMTNGLQDAWGVFRFIDPKLFGSWIEFRNRHLIYGGYMSYSITGYKEIEEVEQQVTSRSFQWVGDLPAAPDVPIYVTLDPATRKIYDSLRKDSVAEVMSASGEKKDVLVRIALTQATRLQQVTSGFVREVGGECIDVGYEKARATIELVTDAVAAGKQVVVFCRYLHDLDNLEARLKAEELRVGRVQGGTDRAKISREFDEKKYDVIVAQIRAASLGIDLAAAEVGVFYSTSFSLDDFLQAKGRLTGMLRQRHRVTFYHMIVKQSVDQKIYKALAAKTVLAQKVTSLRYALDLLSEN